MFKTKLHKLIFPLMLILVVLMNYGYTLVKKDNPTVTSNWEKVEQAYRAFVAYPTEKMTMRFYQSLPGKEAARYEEAKWKSLDYISSERWLLEREITAGNRYAVLAALKLLNHANIYWNSIYVKLSELIRINPRLFLEVLNEHGKSEKIEDIGRLVGTLSSEHIFLSKTAIKWACLYELKMRFKALEGVKGEELDGIRTACLRALKKEIEQYSVDASEVWTGFGSLASDSLEEEIIKTIDRTVEDLYHLEIKDVLIPKTDNASRICGLLYHLLCYELYAGNRYAAELFFRGKIPRLCCSDLDAISDLSRINPRLYLEYSDKIFSFFGSYPFKLTGVDPLKVNIYHKVIELQKMVDAFSRVKDKKYFKVRDACIKQLRIMIKKERREIARRSSENMEAKKIIDWNQIFRDYERYFKRSAALSGESPYFSFDNFLAGSFGNILLIDRPYKEVGNRNRAIKRFLSGEGSQVLYNHFISGSGAAVEVYLMLLNYAQGVHLELLLSRLDWLVQNNPQPVLHRLSFIEGKNILQDKLIKTVMTFVPSKYKNNPKAAIHILEKRLEALETVKDPDYEEVKAICQDKIRNKIEELKKRIR